VCPVGHAFEVWRRECPKGDSYLWLHGDDHAASPDIGAYVKAREVYRTHRLRDLGHASQPGLLLLSHVADAGTVDPAAVLYGENLERLTAYRGAIEAGLYRDD
jgi:hypothetical protein